MVNSILFTLALGILICNVKPAVCTSVGYLTSFWDIPMFPEFCSDASMDNKTIYNTMIRIGGSWAGLGTAFVQMMLTYGWQHVTLLADTTQSACYYGGSAMTRPMAAANMTLNWVRLATAPSDLDIDDYLNQARAKSRGKRAPHAVFTQLWL